MLPDRLKRIIEVKHEELARLLPRAQHLRAAAIQRDDFRGFAAALDRGRDEDNFPLALGLIAEVKAGGYHKVMEGLFGKFVHPSRANDATLRKIVFDMADDVGPDAFVWQLEAIMTRADSRPTLAQIKCPTLVLTSDTDNMVPNEFSTELANGIAGAKLVTIPDCGHLPQLEKPQAMTDAMLDWLEM